MARELYIDLQQVLASAQILFYLVTSTVVILTYINARKSLLNPVHTEYQKHVINKLKELSEELYSEFNPESPNHWIKQEPNQRLVDEVNQQFRWAQEKDIDMVAWGESSGFRTSHKYERSWALMQSVKADPFIPSSIRERVVEFLESRARVHHELEIEAQQYYKRALARGEAHEDLDENFGWVHNRINDGLYKRGFGISQVEEKINDLRLQIQRYLESFSPHR